MWQHPRCAESMRSILPQSVILLVPSSPIQQQHRQIHADELKNYHLVLVRKCLNLFTQCVCVCTQVRVCDSVCVTVCMCVRTRAYTF